MVPENAGTAPTRHAEAYMIISVKLLRKCRRIQIQKRTRTVRDLRSLNRNARAEIVFDRSAGIRREVRNCNGVRTMSSSDRAELMNPQQSVSTTTWQAGATPLHDYVPGMNADDLGAPRHRLRSNPARRSSKRTTRSILKKRRSGRAKLHPRIFCCDFSWAPCSQ